MAGAREDTRGGGSRSAGGGGGGRAIKLKNGKTSPIHSYKDAIRETIYIESTLDDDGNGHLDLIATDIIRPRGSGTNFKVSAIYEMSPYYQAIFGEDGEAPVKLGRGNEHEVKEDSDGEPHLFPLYYDNYFVPRGYAFIAQDMPGTRNSEGCMTLGGNGELAAAKATMRWLNGKGTAYAHEGVGNPLTRTEVEATWSNGKAGMIGKSYDGTIANAAASMGLRGLKTIVPVGGINRWYNYMYHHGVQYTGNTATGGLFTYYIDQPPPDDEEAPEKWFQHTVTENTLCEAKPDTSSAYVSGPAGSGNPTGDYTNFWDERDYFKDPKELPSNIPFRSNVKQVRASVFIANGINDYNVKPNNGLEWFRALKRNGVPVKMWQSQTGHVDPFDYRRGAWVKALHEWFDRWLYGVNNRVMSGPDFDIERVKVKNGKPRIKWDKYSTWPAPNARKVRLWLGPATKKNPGTLTRRRPKKGETQEFSDTYPSWNTMTSTSDSAEGDRLLFLSGKLRRKVRVSGEFPIKITAQVDRADTNFTFLLVDYGRATRVDHNGSGEGIRTLTTESCHGARPIKGSNGSDEKDDSCFFKTEKVFIVNDQEIVTSGWLDAKHRPRKQPGPRPYRHLRQSKPLDPGRRYAFKWSAFGEDYIFQRGHRIGVAVAGSDSTYTNPDGEQANVTVHLRGSRVLLPVVGKAGLRTVRRATR